MPSVTTYALVSLAFTITYFLTLLSINLPNWLLFDAKPWFRINYGLFKRCSALTTECHPFPSRDNGDCDEKYFCEQWEAAGFAMLFATFIGGITWCFLVVALIGGRNRRENLWVSLSMLMIFHAALSVLIGIVLLLNGLLAPPDYEPLEERRRQYLPCFVDITIIKALETLGIETCPNNTDHRPELSRMLLMPGE
ncbi:3871_t:CDS:2, partial [Ambispora leptoticha]